MSSRPAASPGGQARGLAAAREVPAGGEAAITLGLLSAVEDNSAVTQRSVASQLGIALGLANAYLKRCVRKGWIKVNQAPPNRYAYYLTPQGFAEKSRLTAEYLSHSFRFFRGARSQCDALLAQCARRGWNRIVLAGASELSEIASLCALQHPGLTVIAILDRMAEGPQAGRPVVRRLAEAGAVDAVIVTAVRDAPAVRDAAMQELSAILEPELAEERVLIPPLLRLAASATGTGVPAPGPAAPPGAASWE